MSVGDMKQVIGLIGAAMVLLGVSARASAAADDDVQFRIAPYIWVPGFDAEVGTRDVPGNGQVGSDAPPYDVLGNLDYAVMLAGEARFGKLAFVFDGQAVKLGDEGAFTTALGGSERGFEYDVTVADATL